MRRLVALCLLGSILAACGPDAIEVLTSLPTAVPPDGEPGAWAIGFQYEFPPEFWGKGLHRYAFLVRCPVASAEDISTDWQIFEVSEDAPLQPFPIYLRVQGLSTGAFAPLYLSHMAISPQQQTIAAIYLVGLSERAAVLARECEAMVFWDDVGRRVLVSQEPFQP